MTSLYQGRRFRLHDCFRPGTYLGSRNVKECVRIYPRSYFLNEKTTGRVWPRTYACQFNKSRGIISKAMVAKGGHTSWEGSFVGLPRWLRRRDGVGAGRRSSEPLRGSKAAPDFVFSFSEFSAATGLDRFRSYG